MPDRDNLKILIIGSNGFIGSHLVRYFGSKALVYSADIVGAESATHTRLPTERPDFAQLVAKTMPDICINCAGAADVGRSFGRPDLDYRLNVAMVHDILEAIRMHAPKVRFINLSSAAVYGDPLCDPVAEQSALVPISPYGWHKLMAESLCREYADCFDIPTLSLRLFSVYGPGLRKQLYWDVFQKSLTCSEIVCPGTGAETRDYIFVTDVVRAIDLCIAKAEFSGQALNVANGEGVPIYTAVRTLLDALQWSGQLSFNGINNAGNPLKWRADIGGLLSLGYQPAHSFNAGIRELVQWLTTLR